MIITNRIAISKRRFWMKNYNTLPTNDTINRVKFLQTKKFPLNLQATSFQSQSEAPIERLYQAWPTRGPPGDFIFLLKLLFLVAIKNQSTHFSNVGKWNDNVFSSLAAGSELSVRN